METERVHRTVSADGTVIAGRVYGQGPPLVLVHGNLADGEVEWGALLPRLSARFTCYAMSTRCRGLSGHSDDLSPERVVQDVTAFVDSIGPGVGLAGISGGGTNALGAAARSAAVAAVAVWEPVVIEAVSEEVAAAFQRMVERVGADYAAGRPVDAARGFLAFVGNDVEMAALSDADDLEPAARYVPVDLAEIEQSMTATGPSPTDASVLASVTAPVLLLRGTKSAQGEWFRAGLRYAAEHLPHPRVREVDGAGHLTHLVTPEPIARELLEFFTTNLDPRCGSPAPAWPPDGTARSRPG